MHSRKENYDSPIKTPWQDVFRNRPGFVGKGGIAGAFEQPARYIADYAWRHYGGDEKVRALKWKYRREAKHWIGTKLISTYGKPYRYAKNLQKSSKLRASERGGKYSTVPYRSRRGFAYSRPIRRHRCYGTNRKCYQKICRAIPYRKFARKFTGNPRGRAIYTRRPNRYRSKRRWW